MAQVLQNQQQPTNKMGAPTMGGVKPAPSAPSQSGSRVSIAREPTLQTQGGNFAQFNDAAYNKMASRLDHQYEGERKSFDQRMVNQGLVAGTEAYDNALKNFEQNKADAYDGARTSAMQFGLNAQAQDFNQRATARGLDLQDKFGSLGAALNQQNFNFNKFTAMDSINRAYNDQAYRDAVFNASRNDQQYSQLASALLGGMPQKGAQPIDVTGAYNMKANAAMGQYNAQMQQATANQASFNNLLGTSAMAGAMFFSSRQYKENGKAVDRHQILDAINNLDVERWNYRGETRKHIGPYSEEFNQAIGNDVETDRIAVPDAIGALMASIQALTERVQELEGHNESA